MSDELKEEVMRRMRDKCGAQGFNFGAAVAVCVEMVREERDEARKAAEDYRHNAEVVILPLEAKLEELEKVLEVATAQLRMSEIQREEVEKALAERGHVARCCCGEKALNLLEMTDARCAPKGGSE